MFQFVMQAELLNNSEHAATQRKLESWATSSVSAEIFRNSMCQCHELRILRAGGSYLLHGAERAQMEHPFASVSLLLKM